MNHQTLIAIMHLSQKVNKFVGQRLNFYLQFLAIFHQTNFIIILVLLVFIF